MFETPGAWQGGGRRADPRRGGGQSGQHRRPRPVRAE